IAGHQSTSPVLTSLLPAWPRACEPANGLACTAEARCADPRLQQRARSFIWDGRLLPHSRRSNRLGAAVFLTPMSRGNGSFDTRADVDYIGHRPLSQLLASRGALRATDDFAAASLCLSAGC